MSQQSIFNQNLSANGHGYSPDCSSPLSQQSSILQARFNQPNNAFPMSRQLDNKNAYKENFASLPIFMDDAKMGSGLQPCGDNKLNELSDEFKIKSLNINMQDNISSEKRRVPLNSQQENIVASCFEFNDNHSHSRPFGEKTHTVINSPPKKQAKQSRQTKQSQQSNSSVNRKNLKYDFRKASKESQIEQQASRKGKENPSSLFAKKYATRKSDLDNETKNPQFDVQRQATQAIAEVVDQAVYNSGQNSSSSTPSLIQAPAPHPLPTFNDRHILDDHLNKYAKLCFDQSSPLKLHQESSYMTNHTNLTNQTETRLQIGGEQYIKETETPTTNKTNYRQHVQTDSDYKQKNFIDSPDIQINYSQNFDAHHEKTNFATVQVHQFNDPSTIQEEFTEEQLQSYSHVPQQKQQQVHQEFTDVQFNVDQIDELESESFQQIKLISAVKNNTNEYFCNNHENSSSLKDFSEGDIVNEPPSEIEFNSTLIGTKESCQHVSSNVYNDSSTYELPENKELRKQYEMTNLQKVQNITAKVISNQRGFVDIINNDEEYCNVDNAYDDYKSGKNMFQLKIEQSTLNPDEYNMCHSNSRPNSAVPLHPPQSFRYHSNSTDLFKPVLKLREEQKNQASPYISTNQKNSKPNSREVSPSSSKVVYLAPKQFMERQSALTSRASVASLSQNVIAEAAKLDSHLNRISRCDSAKHSFKQVTSFTNLPLTRSPSVKQMLNKDLGIIKSKPKQSIPKERNEMIDPFITNSIQCVNKEPLVDKIKHEKFEMFTNPKLQAKSKFKKQTNQPSLSARHNFNRTVVSSRQLSKDTMAYALITQPVKPSTTPRASTSNQIVKRRVYKQPMFKNADSEIDKATLYQMKRASDAIKSLDIHMFMELERIKRPSTGALYVAKLSCVFFEIFRERGMEFMDKVEGLVTWSQIQDYISNSLTNSVFELKGLLRQKSLSIESPRSKSIEAALKNLKETFFVGQRIRLIKRFIQTSKLLKGLVHLVWSLTCLFLNIEKEYSDDHLLGLTDQQDSHSAEKEYVVIKTKSPLPQTKQGASSKMKTRERTVSEAQSHKSKSPFTKSQKDLKTVRSRMTLSTTQFKPQCMVENVDQSPKTLDKLKIEDQFEKLYQPINRKDQVKCAQSTQYLTVSDNRGNYTARTNANRVSQKPKNDIKIPNFRESMTTLELGGHGVQKPKEVSITPLSRPRQQIIVLSENDEESETTTSRKVATYKPQQTKSVPKLSKKQIQKKTPSLYTKRESSQINQPINRNVTSAQEVQEKRWNITLSTQQATTKPNKSQSGNQHVFKSSLHNLKKSGNVQKQGIDQQCETQRSQLRKSSNQPLQRGISKKSLKTKSQSRLRTDASKKSLKQDCSSGQNKSKQSRYSLLNKHLKINKAAYNEDRFQPLSTLKLKQETKQLLETELPSFGLENECLKDNVVQIISPQPSGQKDNRQSSAPFTPELNYEHFNELSPFVSGQNIVSENPSSFDFLSYQGKVRRSRDERHAFILEKAAQINENINSCQKSKEMAMIDMDAIGRLKKQHTQPSSLFSKRKGRNGSLKAGNTQSPKCKSIKKPLHKFRKSVNTETQSCNVVETESAYKAESTVKDCEIADQDEMTREPAEMTVGFNKLLANRAKYDDQTFANAMSQLRAEVENLMQKRKMKSINEINI